MDEGAAPAPAPQPPRYERRAALLVLLFVVLLAGSVLYLLFARGLFEPTQRLVLVADDSEGVTVGMDMTFSGFPIGRVRRIELADDGSARILIDVPRKDAHWLRTSSVFTLSRGIVGSPAIRAYSGILADPPLPAGAVRKVLSGDASAEIPRLLNATRELLANLTAMTASDSALANTLDKLAKASEKVEAQLGGRRGALDLMFGAEAPKVVAAVERTNRLLESVDALVKRADGVIARADDKLLGEQGVAADAQAAVRQLNTLLTEARASLARVDGVLKEAEAVARNARVATTDLGALRAEVDASLRKVEALVDEVNRRWPFKRDPELKLP